MNRKRRQRLSLPSATLIAAVLSVVFVVAGGGLAYAATAATGQVITADDPGVPAAPALPDPLISTPPGSPTPDPTATDTPTPDPTDTSIATPDPTDSSVPTDTPTPTETPVDTPTATPEPTETTTPSAEVVVPVEPAPSEEPTPTPTPTETPTPTPTPTATATVVPAPAIDLPFYPPASNSVGRDAFPFAIAGVAAAVLLFGGLVAFALTRWRLRRLRFAPVFSSGGRRGSSAPPLGSHLLTSGHALASVAMPWATRSGAAQTAGGPSFALGFASLAALPVGRASDFSTPWPAETSRTQGDGAQNATATTAFELGFERTSESQPAKTVSKRSFLLGFSRSRRASRVGSRSVDLSVFDSSTPVAKPQSEPTPDFGLALGSREMPAPTVPPENYDLGLPPL